MTWTRPGPEETAPYGRALELIGAKADKTGETALLPGGHRMRLMIWGDVDGEDTQLETAGLLEAVATDGLDSDILVLLPVAGGAIGRRLRNRGVAYLDSNGNAGIHLPGLHVHVEGKRAPAARARVRRGGTTVHGGPGALGTPAGLQVVFALLQAPGLRQASVREVAEASRVSVGTAQQALRSLRREDYLRVSASPQRAIGRRGELIWLWAAGYRERLVRTLETRFVTASAAPLDLVAALREGTTASLAGDVIAPGIKNGTGIVVFDRPPWPMAVRVGRLRTASGPTDVILRERFWNEDVLSIGHSAPVLLTAAELLCTSDPRLREAGNRLLTEEARRD